MYPWASCRSFWTPLNIAPSIIIFVERCRRPRTQQLRLVLWFHGTICLETTKHYIMLVKLQTHIKITSCILCPQEDYKHPHNREKNCTPNFSPSLDWNSSATEISTQSPSISASAQSVTNSLFPLRTWALFDLRLSLVWPSGSWLGWANPPEEP